MDIRITLSSEAQEFLDSLPIKVQTKFAYNMLRLRNGSIDSSLFKKLAGTNIWELRTLFNGLSYRLFAFWDTETQTLIVATHGIVKKSNKTPLKEIAKAEAIRQSYFLRKKR